MEKIIFFGLVIPIFAFVLYLGANAIMKGMSAKNSNKVNENDPDQLTNSVNEMLENKEKAARITNAGYDFVTDNLTWEILLPKYVKFYEDLLNS